MKIMRYRIRLVVFFLICALLFFAGLAFYHSGFNAVSVSTDADSSPVPSPVVIPIEASPTPSGEWPPLFITETPSPSGSPGYDITGL